MTRRRVAIGAALAGIVVLAVLLRRWGWENWSLWLDECLQVFTASHPTREIIAMLRNERNHPPLDFLLTHVALRVSSSALFLRWVPTAASAATAGLVFLRAGGARRPFPALGAAFAFAVLPFAVHQGQELRAYAIALFWVAVADLCRMEHARTGLPRALAGEALASILALYCLYVSLFPLVLFWLLDAVAAFRPSAPDARARRRALVVPVATLLAFLPWLLAVRSNLTRPNEIAAPPLTVQLAVNHAVGFLTGREASASRSGAALVVFALVAVGLVAAERAERVRLAAELGGVVLATVLFLTVTNHWFELRYFWFALWPLSQILGEGLGAASRLQPRLRVPAFLTLAAVLFAVELPALAENARSGRVDWRLPVAYVASREPAGREPVIVPSDWWSYMLLHYQSLQWDHPFRLEEPCLTPGQLKSALARISQGWVSRAPYGGSASSEVLKTTEKPWAVFDRADGVSLYRFESGRIISP